MAKLKVMSIEIAAPVSKKEAILDVLQRLGCAEISLPVDIGSLTFSELSREFAENQKKLEQVNKALSIVKKYRPEKKSPTSFLEPRKEFDFASFALLSKRFEKIFPECEKINGYEELISDCRQNIIKYQAEIDELTPWEKADMPMKCEKLKHMAYITGSFRKSLGEEELNGIVASQLEKDIQVQFCVVQVDTSMTCVTAVARNEDIDAVENVLRNAGFVRAPECPDENAACAIRRIKEKIGEAQKLIDTHEEKLCSCFDKREEIEFAKDFLCVSGDRLKESEKMPSGTHLFYIKGYAAQRDAERIKETLEEKYSSAVAVSEPQPDEDVPVILSNNFFAAPLEGITGMYSLPGKNDPDPTGIMAFFYYFFFGMMLSDAGYGLLMVIATGIVLLKGKKIESKLRNTCLMYFFCGLSTVFWGAMYGSWFGDMINVVRTEFLGLPEVRLYIWLEPVNSLMELMVYCFLFGLVHLFTGVAVKAVTDWKNGDKLAAFCDSVPTYLSILGIAPIFFGLFTDVPPIMTKIGTPVLIVGLILVVLTGGRDAKSVGGKLGGGLYEVYNLIGGYLGDVLSYARLLALGLSTGVIAEVMNMLGVLPQNKFLKLAMFIVVSVVGHVANFAINVIGAYVHTNRLQYVEFFGKFYEGGGRAFVPFKAQTEYYKFKEENLS